MDHNVWAYKGVNHVPFERRNEIMKRLTIIATIVIALSLGVTPAMSDHNAMEAKDFHGFKGSDKPSLIQIDKKKKSITFGGVVMADRHEAFVHQRNASLSGKRSEGSHVYRVGIGYRSVRCSRFFGSQEG